MWRRQSCEDSWAEDAKDVWLPGSVEKTYVMPGVGSQGRWICQMAEAGRTTPDRKPDSMMMLWRLTQRIRGGRARAIFIPLPLPCLSRSQQCMKAALLTTYPAQEQFNLPNLSTINQSVEPREHGQHIPCHNTTSNPTLTIPTLTGLRSSPLHLLARDQRCPAQVPPEHLARKRPSSSHL